MVNLWSKKNSIGCIGHEQILLIARSCNAIHLESYNPERLCACVQPQHILLRMESKKLHPYLQWYCINRPKNGRTKEELVQKKNRPFSCHLVCWFSPPTVVGSSTSWYREHTWMRRTLQRAQAPVQRLAWSSCGIQNDELCSNWFFGCLGPGQIWSLPGLHIVSLWAHTPSMPMGKSSSTRSTIWGFSAQSKKIITSWSYGEKSKNCNSCLIWGTQLTGLGMKKPEKRLKRE